MAETELDRSKRLALEIKETIETSTHSVRVKMLNDLYTKWIVESNQGNTIFDYLNLAVTNFNLNIETMQIGLFDRALKILIFQLTYLHLFIFSYEQLTQDEKTEYNEKFTKLFRAIIDAGNAISSSLYLMSSMTLEDIGKEKTTKIEMFRYSELDYENLTPCQLLILYMLEKLQHKQYRRYVVEDKGMCYQKIFNDKGYDTHAWKPAMTIKEFILDNARKEVNAQMWIHMTSSKENLRFVTDHLTVCLTPEFEDLEKDRHIFSFNNGLYINKVKAPEDSDLLWTDQWIPFEGKKAKKIGASIVSSKYFNLNFEDCSIENGYEDWFSIVTKKCPHFRSVMEYQQWPEEVQRWMCILMGRMQYNVGELDDWQVFIFLLGTAGSGKCMEVGTNVMLSSGKFRAVEDIKVGDLLMSDNSKTNVVTAVCKGSDHLYIIYQENGMDYVVNSNHILSLVNMNKLLIEDIPVLDYIKLSIEQKKMYKGYKVSIKFPSRKLSVNPHTYVMNNDLDSISDNYKYNNYENQLELLQSLITKYSTGEAELRNFKKAYMIQNCAYQLLMDIQFVAQCLGYTTEIHLDIHPMPDTLLISKDNGRNQIFVNGINDYLLTDIEVQYYGVGEYAGFEITGNQRFILEDFTVTHNSTIIENILKQFYEQSDVGIVGNNIEKKFGLSSLVGKKIVLGPEIKGNWAIDQAELQSMISGESVQVNTKFKQASSVKFSSHIAIAGNVTPEFQDNAGSMSRRTIVFPFDYKVKKGDAKLGDKIQKELAYIIQACNKGYLDAVYKYGSVGIWEVLPPLFKETQQSMAENTNALAHFLKTEIVILGPQHYCREKIFVAAFNDHCKQSHFHNSKWTSQFYSSPFADAGIKMLKNARKRYPNINGAPTYTGCFLEGVDIRDTNFAAQLALDVDNETSAFD